jgi:hypothetical protein
VVSETDRAQSLLVAGVVGGSVAVILVAFLAGLSGALNPGSGVLGWTGGLVAGVLAVWRVRSGSSLDGRVGDRLSPLDAAALAVFAAVAVRQFGWLLFDRHGALLTLSPYNYGDLPLHWTYVEYLARGARFWPEDPILTGARLRYPLGVDLLSAALVQLGATLRVLLPLMGLCGSALAALALWRWGGALGVSGFVFAGGLAGFQVLWTGRVVDYQSAMDWKNLFLALFLPQRGYLLALPAGLLLLWSGRQRLLRGSPGLPAWIEGVLWGALPLVHLHTFAFVSVVLAVWALGMGRVRALLPSFFWAVLPATWGVLEVTDGFRAASLVGLKPGWTMGAENPVVFLLVNFGLFLPLALAALWISLRQGRREDALVLTPALAILAMLFFVRVAPWEWDNTKVMLWCYVACLPSIGTLVLARMGPTWRGLVLVGLLFSGAVSVAGACRGGGPELVVLDRTEYEGVCRAVRHLPRDARVAVAPTFNHPVALCGQPVVAGYPGHLWSHGLDAGPILQRLESLMRGEPGWRDEARVLRARYLFWGPREASAFRLSRRPWVAAGAPVAEGAWGALYRLD